MESTNANWTVEINKSDTFNSDKVEVKFNTRSKQEVSMPSQVFVGGDNASDMTPGSYRFSPGNASQYREMSDLDVYTATGSDNLKRDNLQYRFDPDNAETFDTRHQDIRRYYDIKRGEAAKDRKASESSKKGAAVETLRDLLKIMGKMDGL